MDKQTDICDCTVAFVTENLNTFLGIWIDSNLEVMYALATRITFICPMRFNSFPMDIQVTPSNYTNMNVWRYGKE